MCDIEEIRKTPGVGIDLLSSFTLQDGDQWYIIIEPKEKKKSSFLGVFGSGDSGKKVHLYTRDSAKHLSHTIEDIRTSQQP